MHPGYINGTDGTEDDTTKIEKVEFEQMMTDPAAKNLNLQPIHSSNPQSAISGTNLPHASQDYSHGISGYGGGLGVSSLAAGQNEIRSLNHT